jgi:hypothetical protein
MEEFAEESSPRAKPTVSDDTWTAHIRRKLAHGYVLIVSSSQPTANFFKPGVGYETCSYRAARHLVQVGAVVEVKTHYLGTIYELATDHAASAVDVPA